MKSPLHILHLEDNPRDVELVQDLLEEEGLACRITGVETRPAFLAALEQGDIDLILADFNLPAFDGLEALALTREMQVEVPFIIFSGTLGEEQAIESLKRGATDYVLKQRPARLGAAVRRAVDEMAEKKERTLALMVEIAERKRTESQIAFQASLLDQVRNAVIATDVQGKIIYWNKYAQTLYQWSADEVIGKDSYGIVVPGEAREQIQKLRADVFGAGYMEAETVLRRKDGTTLPVQISATAVRDAQGDQIGIASVSIDITERKQLEEQLRQAQKMEAIGRLTGGIAHDFNNLLTVILAFSDILLRKINDDSKEYKQLTQIHKAGERAAELVDQLMTFSRKKTLQPRVLDLNAVVTELGKMLQRVIGEHIALVSLLNPALGRVKIDPSQCDQILMNLVVNARDAMPGGGDLTIETANVELDETYARTHLEVTPGPYVMLAVSDTGCGMDAETVSHIFEPFFTTKEQGKGTGLGLATVFGIVKQSGGHIWVYSEPGKGTAFKIYVPRVDAPVDPRQSDRGPGKQLLGSETILVVEDEEVLRDLVRDILTEAGYRVLDARHSDDALQTCARYEEPIHLLVTDMVMPKTSGRELARHLLTLRPALKVLYMSGYTNNTMTQQGTLDPDMAFLHKPFTEDTLLRKVREVLDGPPLEG